MSRTAREWVWSLPDMPCSTRLLLLALAEHIHEGDTCFPGQARLAAMCSVSDRQVRNLLQDLQAKGLITVEHRPGRGRGRKPNVYRLEMGNRQPVCAGLEGQPEPKFRKPSSECREATGNPAQGNRKSASSFPGGQPETPFRNPASGSSEATGNPEQGNRNSSAGNRKSTSAETEDRNGRKKVRDTPPYPPTGGNVTHGHDGFSSPRAGRDNQVSTTPVAGPREATASESAAGEEEGHIGSAGKEGDAPLAWRGTDPSSGQQGSGRRGNTRRGKRNGQDQRLADKDYTVGATPDEDLPDWASAWRDRARDDD